MKNKHILMCIALSVLISACEKPPEAAKTPEDLNTLCNNLDKITDKSQQQEISGKCIRRGKFKPSEPKSY